MKMTAFDIMREWDIEAGIPPRSDEDLLIDVPAGIGWDWYEWVEALEAGDPAAIIEGRRHWGLRPLI
jgi:hypothetical protein